MKHNYRRNFFALLITILFFTSCTGCDSGKTDESTMQKDGPKLNITVSANAETATSIFPPEELGNNLTYKMKYWNIESANITINGSIYPLEKALGDNLITFSDILTYAQLDAKNGICTESFASNHGLTHFTYKYPDYDLRIINDVYETPDGKQHLIRTISVFPAGGSIGPYVDFYNENTWERLDRENWGITLETTKISPTGITVKCTQSGGQQIGQLYTSWYTLQDKNGFVSNLANSGEAPSLELPVKKNDSTVIHIDWTTIYGKLPSGDYQLVLYIEDQFDPSDVHPLMDNFHDMQGYSIPFSIP